MEKITTRTLSQQVFLYTVQSEISKSRCPSSTHLNREALHRSRSAFPYLTPLTAQLTPPGDPGATRSTMMPTRAVHSGLLLLTASAIFNSKAARVIDFRFPLSCSSPFLDLILKCSF